MQNPVHSDLGTSKSPPTFIFEGPDGFDTTGMDGILSDSNESTSSNDTQNGLSSCALINGNTNGNNPSNNHHSNHVSETSHYIDSGGGNQTNGYHHNTTHGTKRKLDSSDASYHPNEPQSKKIPPPNGKKTKGRVKIKMEFIDNKLRRYTTFSKRKTGIMKKVTLLSRYSQVSNR